MIDQNKIRYLSFHDGNTFSNSGSGFEIAFTPTKREVLIVLDIDSKINNFNCEYIGVYLGDKLIDNYELENGHNEVFVNLNIDVEPKTLRVIKLNEAKLSSFTLTNIRLDGAALNDILPSNRKLIGFFGDSLTCGYGVNGKNKDEFEPSKEDFTKTYAYIASQKLNMDYEVTSQSGIGLISKIYCPIIFKEIYRKSERSLNYAVINLGTNDYGEYKTIKDKTKKEEFINKFKEAYIALVAKILVDNPGVRVVFCYNLSPLDDSFIKALRDIEHYVEHKLDNECVGIKFKSDSSGVFNHPNEAAHKKAGEELYDEMILMDNRKHIVDTITYFEMMNIVSKFW